MDEDYDLRPGRLITIGNQSVSKQDEVNRQVQEQLMSIAADLTVVRTQATGAQRKANAAIAQLETDVFVLERRMAIRKIWLWFASVTAVFGATGMTVTWILLGIR